ncbi:MAG: hypothetical protein ACRDQ4_27575 [Pseudonocardiaceae bacterium]
MTPPPVIFDCDGLLADTHGHWDRTYTALFTRYRVPLHRADRRHLVGLGLERLGHALADLLDCCWPFQMTTSRHWGCRRTVDNSGCLDRLPATQP